MEAIRKKKADEEAALKAVKEKATAEEKKKILTRPVPKTATAFEQDLRTFKTDKEALVGFLHSIPNWTLEGYFKKAEIPAPVLS